MKDWAYVVLWTISIYAVVPFARDIVRFLGKNFGGDPTLHVLFGGMVFLALFYFGRKLVTRPGFDLPRGLWFAAVAAGYAWFMWTIKIPPEKIHFLQYGILALLLFQALGHHVGQAMIYPQVVAIAFMVGLLDEYLQSLVPLRVGELEDAFLNLASVLLALVGLNRSWRPASPRSTLIRRDVRRTAGLMIAAILSGGGFILGLSDFGHKFTDPGIGTFNSSFTIEELVRVDAARGAECAAILDATDDTAYGKFLRTHSRKKDAYLHESRVHLFSRDRNLAKARKTNPPPTWADQLVFLRTAFMENRILENYYPTLMAHTRRHRWTQVAADLEAEVTRLGLVTPDYESYVGNTLIIHYNRWSLFVRLGLLIAAVLLLALFAARVVPQAPNLPDESKFCIK